MLAKNTILATTLFFIGFFAIALATSVIMVLAFFSLDKINNNQNKNNTAGSIHTNSSNLQGSYNKKYEIALKSREHTLNISTPFSLQKISATMYTGDNLTLGRVLGNTGDYTRYSITYDDGMGFVNSGIMNVPHGEGPFPVLIVNHGYIYPPEYTNGRGLKREQDYFAQRGYVVLHPDYRNHADSSKDDRMEVVFRTLYTEDVINAVEAVKNSELDFLDKENIGMLGHSMGGGITLNVVSTKPNLVKGAVLYAPVSGNFEKIFNRWVVQTEEEEKIYEKYGTPKENPDFWKGLSAETFYNAITIPLLFHQGTADDEIPLHWTEDTVDVLLKKDKEVEYYVYENGSHEFINEWMLFMERNIDFFDSLLK